MFKSASVYLIVSKNILYLVERFVGICMCVFVMNKLKNNRDDYKKSFCIGKLQQYLLLKKIKLKKSYVPEDPCEAETGHYYSIIC